MGWEEIPIAYQWRSSPKSVIIYSQMRDENKMQMMTTTLFWWLLTYKNYGDEDEDEDDLQLISDDLQLISDDLQLFHHHVTTYNFCLILTTYL